MLLGIPFGLLHLDLGIGHRLAFRFLDLPARGLCLLLRQFKLTLGVVPLLLGLFGDLLLNLLKFPLRLIGELLFGLRSLARALLFQLLAEFRSLLRGFALCLIRLRAA